MAKNLSGRDVRARLVLDGDFATPFIAYDINAARLAFDGTGVEGLRASGRAEVNAEQVVIPVNARRSEEHTSELQSLMSDSYAVFCLKKKTHCNEAREIVRLQISNASTSAM